MSSPDPSNCDYVLPPECKGLIDALRCQQKEGPSAPYPPVTRHVRLPEKEGPSAPYPPVTRHVRLPEKVSVLFLAEASGQDLHAIMEVMTELRIIVSVNRSVDFADAQKILRRYGIWAARGATNV